MADDKAVITLIEAYFSSYPGRDLGSERKICDYLHKDMPKYILLYTKFACAFLKKSSGWNDFLGRQSFLVAPATKKEGESFADAHLGVKNKELKKAFCNVAIRLINEFGLPKDEYVKKAIEHHTWIDFETEKGLIFKKRIPKPKEQVILDLEAAAAS